MKVAALLRALAGGAWLLRQRVGGGGEPAGPAGQAWELSRLVAAIGRRHGMAIDVHGRLPLGPTLLVANHLSYLDPIALLSLMPALPVCKAEVGRWPLLGSRVRASGVLLVDRADPWSGARVLRRTRAALAGGASVLVFPEGTTTPGDRVLPFRRGSFGIARRARVPITPVAIWSDDPLWSWTGRARFLPHYLRAAAAGRLRVQVAFGAPIHSNAPADELAELARDRVQTILRRLRHVPAERVRVSASRPDAVLSAGHG
jgi:1-acyl-sn-glycerol-3-phosphate acyltransferase